MSQSFPLQWTPGMKNFGLNSLDIGCIPAKLSGCLLHFAFSLSSSFNLYDLIHLGSEVTQLKVLILLAVELKMPTEDIFSVHQHKSDVKCITNPGCWAFFQIVLKILNENQIRFISVENQTPLNLLKQKTKTFTYPKVNTLQSKSRLKSTI